MPTPDDPGRPGTGGFAAAARRLMVVVPVLATLIPWVPVRAQETSPRPVTEAGVVTGDTIPVVIRDTIPPSPWQTAPVERREKKSSLKAVGLSAILPGAGQVYTEQYWKVPLILGLGGYWVYEWSRNNDRYREFRDLYSASIATTPPQGDGRYLSLREFYKDQRDSFTWYLGVLYLLNVVDAFVGAELYDFDVGPDLTLGQPGMVASVRFHF